MMKTASRLSNLLSPNQSGGTSWPLIVGHTHSPVNKIGADFVVWIILAVRFQQIGVDYPEFNRCGSLRIDGGKESLWSSTESLHVIYVWNPHKHIIGANCRDGTHSRFSRLPRLLPSGMFSILGHNHILKRMCSRAIEDKPFCLSLNLRLIQDVSPKDRSSGTLCGQSSAFG